jgi:pre-mRNA-splicing factor 38A
MCLLLKLLQITPDFDIILEYIRAKEFKYLRILGAVYLRLTATPIQVYTYLEPLLADFRKVVIRLEDGSFKITTIDQVIDDLLTNEFMFNISLPRLPLRRHLEEAERLLKRIPLLDENEQQVCVE